MLVYVFNFKLMFEFSAFILEKGVLGQLDVATLSMLWDWEKNL